MKLGIDFGTSHTVVALPDQGNYPIVSFNTPDGDWIDYYPSILSVKQEEVRFGFEGNLEDNTIRLQRALEQLKVELLLLLQKEGNS